MNITSIELNNQSSLTTRQKKDSQKKTMKLFTIILIFVSSYTLSTPDNKGDSMDKKYPIISKFFHEVGICSNLSLIEYKDIKNLDFSILKQAYPEASELEVKFIAYKEELKNKVEASTSTQNSESDIPQLIENPFYHPTASYTAARYPHAIPPDKYRHMSLVPINTNHSNQPCEGNFTSLPCMPAQRLTEQQRESDREKLEKFYEYEANKILNEMRSITGENLTSEQLKIIVNRFNQSLWNENPLSIEEIQFNTDQNNFRVKLYKALPWTPEHKEKLEEFNQPCKTIHGSTILRTILMTLSNKTDPVIRHLNRLVYMRN
jgi:hypothetical protein